MHYERRAYRAPDLSLVDPNVPPILEAIEGIEQVGIKLLPSSSAQVRARVKSLVFATWESISLIDPDGRDAPEAATNLLPGPERYVRHWLQYILLMMNRALDPAQANLDDNTVFWKERLRGVRRAAEQSQTVKASPAVPGDNRASLTPGGASPLPAGESAAAIQSDDKGMFTVTDLAERFKVPAEPLRKRLDRWRLEHAASDGWIESADATSRTARYSYQLGAVRGIIDALRASGEASGKRPTKKNPDGKRR